MFWKTGIKERNKLIFNKTNSSSLENILNNADAIFQQLLVNIEKLTEEELTSIFPGMTRSIGIFIQDLSYGHYDEHDYKLQKRFGL